MNKKPICPPEPPAVVSVPSIENIKSLKNAFVYVMENNTTYYISPCHEVIVVAQGDVYIRDYDYKNNPLKLRNQTVYDFKNNRAIHYAPNGDYRISALKEDN